MRTLLLACGNPLRGDDGVASAVLELIAPSPLHTQRAVQQLTPELAEEVGKFARVVFIDADAESKRLKIEPVRNANRRAPFTPAAPFTHAVTPEEIVALASALYGFAGEAFLCRIPAGNFSPGEKPEPGVLRCAQDAAAQIANLI